MESATIRISPSTGLSGILLSEQDANIGFHTQRPKDCTKQLCKGKS